MLPLTGIRSMLLRLLLLVGIAWAAVIVLVVIFQRRLVYLPPREYPVTPASLGLPFTAEVLTASDGVRLVAWWIPPPAPSGPVVLFFHGNACNLSGLVELAKEFRELGAGFAAVDYRGYGGSTGSPTEAGLRRDALAAYDRVTGSHGIGRSRLFIWGQSLGAGVASWLAAERPCAGLVLEGAFPSLRAMARLHYPLLPVAEFMLFDRYRTADQAAAASCPVLVLHGDRDVVAPPAFGEAIHAAVAAARGTGAVTLVVVRGAGHDGIHPRHPDVEPAWGRFVRAATDGVTRHR